MTPRAYYNEIDKYCADWLRNLIREGLIAAGDVDDRDIRDVTPTDLVGYRQCHFFAGLGGWSYALRLAGWPDDREVWTGSCPCQPFSQSGKGLGFADERHLWPSWHWLIEQRRPGVVLGEQVASPDGLVWLDLVSTDMEATDYAIGPIDLCSAGLGAPNIRQRLWWMAYAGRVQHNGHRTARPRNTQSTDNSDVRSVGDANGARLEVGSLTNDGQRPVRIKGSAVSAAGFVRGFWRACDWVWHRDGKYRPVEPGAFPLAARVSGDVERLRAYGNAINPEAAAAFIRASIECLAESHRTT